MDMKERLMKFKGKKDKMSDVEKTAKMNVLGEMKGAAEDMMRSKLGGLKKVTVASPSESGLEQGLEKAKEMISEVPLEESEEEMQLPEIEAKIAELMALKAKLSGEQEDESEEEEEELS